MSIWTRTLDLAHEWEKTKRDEMSPAELAKIIVLKLKMMQPIGNTHIDAVKQEIIDALVTFTKDEGLDNDDFDAIIRDLYDWADTPLDDRWNGRKVCWIKTF